MFTSQLSTKDLLFAPSDSDVGNYTIKIILSDNNNYPMSTKYKLNVAVDCA
jgi:hypothetical protein